MTTLNTSERRTSTQAGRGSSGGFSDESRNPKPNGILSPDEENRLKESSPDCLAAMSSELLLQMLVCTSNFPSRFPLPLSLISLLLISTISPFFPRHLNLSKRVNFTDLAWGFDLWSWSCSPLRKFTVPAGYIRICVYLSGTHSAHLGHQIYFLMVRIETLSALTLAFSFSFFSLQIRAV